MNDWTSENIAKLVEQHPNHHFAVQLGQPSTLRDYFAGQALIGLISFNSPYDMSGAIKWAWKAADEMLARRSK